MLDIPGMLLWTAVIYPYLLGHSMTPVEGG